MSIGQRSRFHLLVHYAETSTCVISRNNGATSNTRVFVVGKRVPGTWSRVLDVLVLWTCSCCVDDVKSDSEVRYRISAKSAKVIFDLKPLTTMAVEPRHCALPPGAVARRRCSGGLSPPETPPIRPHHPLPPRRLVRQATAVD